jgi:hypothetical protein
MDHVDIAVSLSTMLQGHGFKVVRSPDDPASVDIQSADGSRHRVVVQDVPQVTGKRAA